MSWGIVGTGAIAARFAVAAKAAGDPVAAVASRSAETGQSFAKRFGIATAVEGAAALAALPQVDAVYIATPNERHLPDALAVIGHGKAVLCEKPFACSAAEAAQIADAARSAGVFAMEGLWSLCLPTYRAAFAAVERGDIGNLLEVHGSFAVPQSPAAMPRLYEAPGGGALLDRGVYLVSLAQALLGELQLVHASGTLTADGVDTAADLVLENAAGARAVLTAGIDRMGDNRLSLFGSKGRITFEEPVTNPAGFRVSRVNPDAGFSGPQGQPGAVSRLKQRLKAQPRLMQLARALLRAPSGAPGGLEDQIRHVRLCLAAGKTESDLVPLDHSLAVMRLIDEARGRITAA